MRSAVIVAVSVVAIASFAIAAWADDPDRIKENVDCNPHDSSCLVEVEVGETLPGQGGSDTGSGSGGGGSVAAVPSCAETDDPGVQECSSVIFDPGPGGEAVDPAVVAASARESIQLPEVGVGMSPPVGVAVWTQVPVWLWIEEEAWQAESATAAVPGGSVSVTAAPSSVAWSMGDGATVACAGPGTAYDPAVHDPAAASPDCGHTYTWPGAYSVEVAVTWSVSWESSTGGGGALEDLATSTDFEVEVVEVPALVD